MLTVGFNDHGKSVSFDINQLTNHTAIFGQSGSGKTGLITALAEQVLEAKVPVVLLDKKGDLANLIKSEIRTDLHVILLTPGANHGNSVDIFAKITDPQQTEHIVQELLAMIGMWSGKATDPYPAFLTSLIRTQFQGQDIELEELVTAIINPKMERFGMVDIDEAIPAKARRELALKINNIIANPSYDLWRSGLTLDFDLLFRRVNDKTPLVIYSVAHLTDEHAQTAAIATLLNEYLQWTLRQPGTSQLRSLLVVDECHSIMPPHPRNPITKHPLLTLLKEARSFGNGVVMVTQNTKDVDYKGLSQCGLWCVGKLQTKHDRERVLEGLLAVSSYDKKTLSDIIASLPKRKFCVAVSEKLHIVKSPEAKTPLSGPLTTADLVSLRNQGYYNVVECTNKGIVTWMGTKKVTRFFKKIVGM